MLLQRLLLRRKRNRSRGRSEFGNHRTIRQSGRRRGGFMAIGVRHYALRLRRDFRRGPDHLALLYLGCGHSDRGAIHLKKAKRLDVVYPGGIRIAFE